MKPLYGYIIGFLIFVAIYWVSASIGSSGDSYIPDCIDNGRGGWQC